jgi:hypothetical protein
MRTITNNHLDAQILNLGSDTDRGPFLVTQVGVAPNDALVREKLFVLRPDGQWVDFNCYVCQGRPEAMDEIVFATITKVMETFGTLLGKPRVLVMPLDEAGLKAWIARQESGDPLQAARLWATQYKNRHRDWRNP